MKKENPHSRKSPSFPRKRSNDQFYCSRKNEDSFLLFFCFSSFSFVSDVELKNPTCQKRGRLQYFVSFFVTTSLLCNSNCFFFVCLNFFYLLSFCFYFGLFVLSSNYLFYLSVFLSFYVFPFPSFYFPFCFFFIFFCSRIKIGFFRYFVAVHFRATFNLVFTTVAPDLYTRFHYSCPPLPSLTFHAWAPEFKELKG